MKTYLKTCLATETFRFNLPEQLIARYPLDKRDSSRLLHYSLESKTIKHLIFTDIISLFKKGDVLVRNNTKVLPARFFISPANSIKLEQVPLIEILLIKPFDADYVWEILGKPYRKLFDNQKYLLSNGQEVLIREHNMLKYVDFYGTELFNKALTEAGNMPIPPYLQREAELVDQERYQTVYADQAQWGSVAAPTAGLHFTDEIFKSLLEKGVEILDLTLHVGPGTFQPIKSEKIDEHKMHPERYSIDETVWAKIVSARKDGRRIISIGTTTTRCLETIARTGKLRGETDIFIYPKNFNSLRTDEFRLVDGMITNFHLPGSTLLLLVSAFAGIDEIKKIYQEAIDLEYRFYSYGDCMFML